MPKAPKEKVHRDSQGRTILDEEKFVECLDHIIERDFFPDLQKLRKETGCLPEDASARVDLRGETFDTPCLNGEGDLATPSRVADGIAPLTAPVRADTSLDSFLNRHTSEDNASYKELAGEEERRRQELADGRFQPSIEYHPKLEAIGYHEKGKDYNPVDLWKFERKSDLMYPPEGKVLENNPNANRKINHPATHLPVEALLEAENAAQSASQLKDRVGIDGKLLDKGTPRVKGYAYCATPRLEPGVDASPLMTWGEVESTPLRAEGSATPARSSAPAFKIPQVPENDRLGMALAERMNKKHKERHTKAMTAMRKLVASSGITPSPGRSPASRRIAALAGASGSSRHSIFSKTPTPRKDLGTPASSSGDTPAGWGDTPDQARGHSSSAWTDK